MATNNHGQVVARLRQRVTPLAEDEETALCQRVSYSLVVPTILVLTLSAIVDLASRSWKGAGLSDLLAKLFILACLGAIYVLSRRGRARLGIVLLVAMGLCVVAYLSLRGYSSVHALFLLVVVAGAGSSLGLRAGFVVAALSCILYSLVVWAQERGWVTPGSTLSLSENVFWFALAVALLAGSIASLYWTYLMQRDRSHVLTQQMDTLRVAGEEKDELLRTVEAKIAEQNVLVERLEAEDRALAQLVSRLRRIFSPVIPILDHVVLMPVVGELTVEQMEAFSSSLLDGVEQYNARLALLDITGVPQISQAAAELFLQTTDAVALLGAECVLVGIRPEVAHAIMDLGIDLSQMISRRDLQSGIAYALLRTGRRIVVVE
jgi:anti-anti-sigma regulatory factor